MQQTNRGSFDSEGFRAHVYLSKETARKRGWAYVASSKLTTTLAESKVAWKKAETTYRKSSLVAPVQLSFNFDLQQVFRSLASWWSLETEHMSNMIKACSHPAYQQIIGMGKVAPSLILPLILHELAQRPDHWFAALHEISGEDPAEQDDNFDEAVEAWMNWGRQKRYTS